jgi:hypothetical protein
MADQPSYDDLVAWNNHLAQQLVGMGDRLQATLREQMAKAWAEGFDAGEIDAFDADHPDHVCKTNPYKEA